MPEHTSSSLIQCQSSGIFRAREGRCRALTSVSMSQTSQILTNRFSQLRGFCKLCFKVRDKLLHLVFERLPIVFQCLRADVAPRRKNVAVGSNLFGCSAFAESECVLVRASALFSPPGMIGARDSRDLFPGKLTMDAIYEVAHFAGIDKERFAAVGCGTSRCLCFEQETKGTPESVCRRRAAEAERSCSPPGPPR